MEGLDDTKFGDNEGDHTSENPTLWIGNIPKHAKVNQIMGAFKSQGFTVCNMPLKINKGDKNTQWTVLEVQDLDTQTRALKYGIKFGNTNLNVKKYQANIKGGKTWGNPQRGRGRGRGRGNAQRGRGHEFHKNKLSNVGRSKTHDPHTTPYKGKGKNRGRGRGRGRGKYANDTNYYKYNKPQFIGFYMTAIIDMSGSMANSRIKAATQGVQGLMGNLNDNDFVSILGFNSKMIKVLEPAPYGTVKDKIPNKLAECVNSVGGGTAMWDALNEAIERQKEFLKKDQNKSKSKRKQRIIVVTDGEDNSSQTSADHVIQEAAFFNLHGKKNFEFVLTVIAVGEAQQLPSLQKLCKPKHCHLVEVGDYNGIAKAIQNEWKRK